MLLRLKRVRLSPGIKAAGSQKNGANSATTTPVLTAKNGWINP
jgi:hypothetical protein